MKMRIVRLAVFFVVLKLAAITMFAQGHSGGCACGKSSLNRVPWEIEHGDNAAYQQAAAEEFKRWNRYIDIFDYRSGDGTVGRNGQNEIVFASINDTFQLYGFRTDEDTFGITYLSPESAFGNFNSCPAPIFTTCGTFTEADVIMNLDFVRGFKPAGPVDFDDNNGPALYGATAVHEIGHTLGFHHNFDNVSVMNYYEDYAAQYIALSDAEVARSTYPAQAQQLSDIAAYPFYFEFGRRAYSATTPVSVSPSSVKPGATLTVRNFMFENLGTAPLSGVELRVYLSLDEQITTSDILVGRLAFSGQVQSGSYWDDEGSGESFTVPVAPVGTYHVGVLAVYNGGQVDTVTYNNSFVAPEKVTILSSSGRKRTVRR